MIRFLPLFWLAGPALAQSIAVPSGQTVTLFEVVAEDQADLGQVWARFRFLAPQIARDAGRLTFEQAEADMLHLCETVALPALAGDTRQFDLVLVSLSDREVPFGVIDPEATQFFEGYRPEEATCILEEF
ncbi:DUF6497 family protein [Pseudogemmobacter sp. W21_MBD1_M6]|jgi:hypothetical protein|uniref:DUF6497 family protein n=1 Tax=Pseudogemmobacter sp. W21_MBD1_M6 TaxID=3240271 RepID=UPI003F977103